MIKFIWRKFFIHNTFLLKCLTLINNILTSKLQIVIILWPPSRDYFKEIEIDIIKEFKILSSNEFLIPKDNVKKFIDEVYNLDYADPKKIINKHQNIIRNENIFKIFSVEVLNPDIIVKDLLNRYGSMRMSNFKRSIRQKYKNKINNYVYDIIIHSTEMTSQEKKINAIIDKYKND